jgi:hypothetical protein
MRHEPSDLCLSIQQTADRRRPADLAVKPLNQFSAGHSASWRGRRAAVARCHQPTLRQVMRGAEATCHAPLAVSWEGGGDAV